MRKNPLIEPEYRFLFEDKQLENNIMFLTYWGSYAYGTNTDNSDTDIRGVSFNTKKQLLGIEEYSHFEDRATDTLIYGFKKYISLLLHSDPNSMEMLGCRDSDYIITTKQGRELIKNRKEFISQDVATSFGKYALSQLGKMKNAIARDRSSEYEKERHILETLEHSIFRFDTKYKDMDKVGLRLYIDNFDSKMQILADMNMQGYPVRQLNGILSDLNEIVKAYGKQNSRNHKKDDIHINKHAMHLVRILLTSIDILETGDINTNREKDLDILLPIKNGQYIMDDGTYNSEFYTLVDELRKKQEYALKNTSIQPKINISRVEELVTSINGSRLLEIE